MMLRACHNGLEIQVYPALIVFFFFHQQFLGYRETAFAYAVSSAGVAHAVSKACGQGKLESCGCDPKSQRGSGGGGVDFGPSATLSDWRWSGCSHNMDFGFKFSRFLLDSRQRGQDIHSRIHLHNSHVGRTVSSYFFCSIFIDIVFWVVDACEGEKVNGRLGGGGGGGMLRRGNSRTRNAIKVSKILVKPGNCQSNYAASRYTFARLEKPHHVGIILQIMCRLNLWIETLA